MRRIAGERGSITPIAAGMLLVLAVVAMGLADVGRVLVARGRAQAVADAAALAAAQSLAFPTGTAPEEAARLLAERGGAGLVSCGCEPGTFEARVEVRVPVGRLLLGPDDLGTVAAARAVVEVP